MDIEQIEKYKKIRDDFREKKTNLLRQIEEHESAIMTIKNEFKVPVLEGCDRIMTCEKCDIHSMKDDGYSPGQGEHFWWYKCVICGHTDYHT